MTKSIRDTIVTIVKTAAEADGASIQKQVNAAAPSDPKTQVLSDPADSAQKTTANPDAPSHDGKSIQAQTVAEKMKSQDPQPHVKVGETANVEPTDAGSPVKTDVASSASSEAEPSKVAGENCDSGEKKDDDKGEKKVAEYNGMSDDEKKKVAEAFDILASAANVQVPEEFKIKMTAVIESGIAMRVKDAVESEKEKLNQKYAAEAAEHRKQIEDAVTIHCDFVSEQIIKENKLELPSQILVSAAEEIFTNLKNITSGFGLSINTTAAEREATEKKINAYKETASKAVSESAAYKKELEQYKKKDIVNKIASDKKLTDLTKTKFVALAETVSYSSLDEFNTKVSGLADTLAEPTKVGTGITTASESAPVDTKPTSVSTQSTSTNPLLKKIRGY